MAEGWVSRRLSFAIDYYVSLFHNSFFDENAKFDTAYPIIPNADSHKSVMSNARNRQDLKNGQTTLYNTFSKCLPKFFYATDFAL